MSSNNFKYDQGVQEQFKTDNKNLLDYILDTSPFENQSKCFMGLPPFMVQTTSHFGIPKKNIQLETVLQRESAEQNYRNNFGLLRPDLVRLANENLENCDSDHQILPNGYIAPFQE